MECIVLAHQVNKKAVEMIGICLNHILNYVWPTYLCNPDVGAGQTCWLGYRRVSERENLERFDVLHFGTA